MSVAKKVSSMTSKTFVSWLRCAFISRPQTRTRKLEESDNPDEGDRAKYVTAKLDTLDAEFRRLHLEIVHLIDDEEELLEQEILDRTDDHILADLKMRLLYMMHSTTPTSSSARKIVSSLLNKALHSFDHTIPTYVAYMSLINM